MIKYDTLYHIDDNGNVRVWWMERENDRYRAISGIEGGQLVTSEWKYTEPKNVGRSNATTGAQQAEAEVESQYTKKLDRKYTRTKESAGRSNIIEPMLADKYKGWDRKWGSVFSQPKLDGMRCIATRSGMFSRQGKPVVTVPHIAEQLRPFFEANPDAVLDGELYNHDLRDNFNELISIARQSKPSTEDLKRSASVIQYHVYDQIGPDKFGVRHHNLIRELRGPSIVIVTTTRLESEEALDFQYGELLKNGYEGQMIRLDAPYEQKRSKRLLKRKEFSDEEFEVIELVEGVGNWAGYAKSVHCRNPAGRDFHAGIKGSQEFTRELLKRNPPPRTVTVRYQNVTPDGSLRFPIAVAFYDKERDV